MSDTVIALDSWTERIIDAESRIKKTQDIRKSVLDSLNRQVLDGLISEQDAIELEYTCDLWINLYKSFLCRSFYLTSRHTAEVLSRTRTHA